jgi:hypothetical protein
MSDRGEQVPAGHATRRDLYGRRRSESDLGLMTRRPERVDFDAAHTDMRVLLRGWDPIGVFLDDDPEMHAPEDEYDCLIPGLYKRLRAGADEDVLHAFIERELVEHFGLTPRPEADREFVGQLIAWWNQRS